MSRPICIVTGATAGLGLATAKGLAAAAAHVVMIARDEARGKVAKEAVLSAVPNATVDVDVADLASLESIRRASERLHDRYPRFDALINNAAIVPQERTLSKDGIELQWAVNHLAPYLFTRLLLDRLAEGDGGRVVNVTSKMHRRGRIDFDDLQFETRKYAWSAAYCQSKLANVLFTYELDRRAQGLGVTSNCFHPGVIATKVARRFNIFTRALSKLLLKTPEQGADTAIYLALSNELDGVSGKFFVDRKAVDSAKASYDEEVARTLWEVSADAVGMPH
ncbi:MAG: SDR family oxidoreductase [Myxococcales bacterium]|nr:SDR family oxidoreductase [Myxococcales bacterium]